MTGWRAYEIVRLGVGIKTQVPSVMNGLTRRGEPVARRRAASHGRERTQAEVAEVIACSVARARSRAAWSASSRTASARWSRSASCSRSGPWLVLLDEPAAGITGAEADQLVALIQQHQPERAVVVVDHDMQFVRMLGGKRHRACTRARC